MRKIVLGAACVSLLACNPLKLLSKSDDSAEGGATTAPAGGGGGSSGGVIAKGLSLVAEGALQGEVDFMVKNPKTTMNATMQVKGMKQRMQVHSSDKPAGLGAVIFDGEKKQMIMLDDDKKQAMVMKLDEQGQVSAPGGPSHAPAAPKPEAPECKATGKSDVVAGYSCDVCVSETPEKKTEVCSASGLAFFGFGKLAEAMHAKFTGFPLRAVVTDKATSKEIERTEVTKIEKKSLGDELFVVPPGYKVVDLAEMFKGLGGAPRR